MSIVLLSDGYENASAYSCSSTPAIGIYPFVRVENERRKKTSGERKFPQISLSTVSQPIVSYFFPCSSRRVTVIFLSFFFSASIILSNNSKWNTHFKCAHAYHNIDRLLCNKKCEKGPKRNRIESKYDSLVSSKKSYILLKRKKEKTKRQRREKRTTRNKIYKCDFINGTAYFCQQQRTKKISENKIRRPLALCCATQ